MRIYLQVSQTSALTDRRGEERRILDLENAVKSVSATDGFQSMFLKLPELIFEVSYPVIIMFIIISCFLRV